MSIWSLPNCLLSPNYRENLEYTIRILTLGSYYVGLKIVFIYNYNICIKIKMRRQTLWKSPSIVTCTESMSSFPSTLLVKVPYEDNEDESPMRLSAMMKKDLKAT